MGMAASQARFLQLTARRSNIEYMGQQINQQRTALANQSAGLFERMLALDPPVPPSSLDDKYFTQGYNFKDNIKDDGTPVFRGDNVYKKITWDTPTATSSPAITDTVFTMTVTDTTVADPAEGGDDSAVLTFSYEDLTADEQNDATGATLASLMNTIGFTEQADTTRSVVRYVTVEHKAYDPEGEYISITEQAPAILEFDNLERLINVTLLDPDGANNAITVTGEFNIAGADVVDGLAAVAAGANLAVTSALAPDATIGQGEELTYSGEFDEIAFHDDMNTYEFQKSAYDYQIERINIETAQIQKQDKSLELKMKQLDTEHKAVQTEMDAVQKVIQKNIESSFKTFA